MKANIREYDVRAAIDAREQVVAVYRSVYSLPPYNEPDSNIQKFSDSWRSRAEKPGFIFVGVDSPQGELVGLAYGWKSMPGDFWNTKLSEVLGEIGTPWLADCFDFVDLAVTPVAQGSGLGRDLKRKLFERVNSTTSILMTHQTTTKASQMYLRNGWVVLKENFEFVPDKLYMILGKKLRS